MSTIIMFRGRNTSNILEDAIRLGVVSPLDTLFIVCRKGDPLKEPVDVEHLPPISGDVICICNGGTTSQQVPTIAALLTRAQDEELDCLSLFEVERDGYSLLWKHDNRDRYICLPCDGTGAVKFLDHQKCWACNGNGETNRDNAIKEIRRVLLPEIRLMKILKQVTFGEKEQGAYIEECLDGLLKI